MLVVSLLMDSLEILARHCRLKIRSVLHVFTHKCTLCISVYFPHFVEHSIVKSTVFPVCFHKLFVLDSKAFKGIRIFKPGWVDALQVKYKYTTGAFMSVDSPNR